MEMSGYVYMCSAGETFDMVALKVYGAEKYACDLMCANPHLTNRYRFDGSEALLLPVVEKTDSSVQAVPNAAPWKE